MKGLTAEDKHLPPMATGTIVVLPFSETYASMNQPRPGQASPLVPPSEWHNELARLQSTCAWGNLWKKSRWWSMAKFTMKSAILFSSRRTHVIGFEVHVCGFQPAANISNKMHDIRLKMGLCSREAKHRSPFNTEANARQSTRKAK